MDAKSKGLMKWTDAAKEKASKSHIGKPLSAFHRRQISKALKGKPKSPETIEKIRLANLGKTLSLAHVASILQANKGNKHALGIHWKHTTEQLAIMRVKSKRYALRRHMDHVHMWMGIA